MKSFTGQNRVHLLLMLIVALNIIGLVANIGQWQANPEPWTRDSLLQSDIAGLVGAENALATGSIILATIAVVYGIALAGLFAKKKWGPLLVIANSIANRAIALFLFAPNITFFVFIPWTIILLIVAYLDFRKISANAEGRREQHTN